MMTKTKPVVSKDLSARSFILITNDGFDPLERRVDAISIADHRLQRSYWPIYSKTPHKGRIAPGDQVAVYIGGKGPAKQSFYATSRVRELVTQRRLDRFNEEDLIISEGAERVLLLEETVYLPTPVHMSLLLGDVSFAPRKIQKWGAYLLGGCKSLTSADIDLILKFSRIKS